MATIDLCVAPLIAHTSYPQSPTQRTADRLQVVPLMAHTYACSLIRRTPFEDHWKREETFTQRLLVDSATPGVPPVEPLLPVLAPCLALETD